MSHAEEYARGLKAAGIPFAIVDVEKMEVSAYANPEGDLRIIRSCLMSLEKDLFDVKPVKDALWSIWEKVFGER